MRFSYTLLRVHSAYSVLSDQASKKDQKKEVLK